MVDLGRVHSGRPWLIKIGPAIEATGSDRTSGAGYLSCSAKEDSEELIIQALASDVDESMTSPVTPHGTMSGEITRCKFPASKLNSGLSKEPSANLQEAFLLHMSHFPRM